MSDSDHVFPFATAVDLSPLVDFWREAARDPANRWSATAKDVLGRVEGIPELTGPVDDPRQLEAHEAGLQLLMSAFTSPLNDSIMAAAMIPWQMTPVYMSTTAAQADLVVHMSEHFEKTFPPEEMFVAMAMKAYGFILEEIYDIRLGFELPFSWVSFRDVESTVPIKCPNSGIIRRFAIDFDTRFVRVEVVGDRPEISAEQIAPLGGNASSLGQLLELLPPENFAFRGVTVLIAEDVTSEAALTAIRDDLLLKDALTSLEGIVHIEEHVQAFVGRSDLQLGLIGVERGEDVDAVVGGRPIGRSLLLADGEAPSCPQRTESLYARALESRQPVFVDDLRSCEAQTGYEKTLSGRGVRGLLVLPLYVEESLIGLLELGSETPGGLSAVNVYKLEKIQAVFALGLKRSMEHEEDRVQAIIKRDYTAIHPVVEWRFRQAAQNRLRAELRGEVRGAEEIVFPNLVPLYGLSDIRNSSVLRSGAVAADILAQLELGKAVISSAQSASPQPALGELEFRLDQYVDSVHGEMATEDESSVLDYLQHQIEPLFDELALLDPAVSEAVESYRASLDPELGMLYDKRQDFEKSVGLVNEMVAGVLHDGERYAQSLVPHFFELFKTDGVDYNIYVGAGLHESREHAALDLANLRLWQLMTTCRIAWALERGAEELPLPLQLTHLVLVQSTPLAVRFRRDEKRFDVDGAYNVRYEIVKKRIDKATIRGTDERLTQPGMIAIAYSQEREATEYRRYLDYLRSPDVRFVEDETEELELNALQGVFGLRAMRVRIRPVESQHTDPELPETLEVAARRLALPTG